MKIISKVGLCVSFATFALMASFAETEVVDGITWTYTVSNGKASVGISDILYGAGGGSSAVPRSTTGAITIPSLLGGMPVTRIDYYAFSYCQGLTSVTIPDSVTCIERGVFYECSNLQSLTLPYFHKDMLIEDYYSIDGCHYHDEGIAPPRLTSIVITGDGNIGDSSFEGLGYLTNIVINGNVAAIGGWAFKGCTSLVNINIPDTVTSIGDEAFYNCSSLAQLMIPSSVTHYGANCFEGCPAYTLRLYRTVFGGAAGSGSMSIVTTVVQQVEAPYALSNAPADRAIADVTVDADCALDSFVLKEGKVYDSVLYIKNNTNSAVKVTLPSGHTYQAFKGATPLTLPANSQSILTITRVAGGNAGGNVFLVTREELETVQ